VVSESGINHREDVERLQEAGIDAILVGEALMREEDIAAKVRELLGT
jgi:indole-3-glycerol phosphate synthase